MLDSSGRIIVAGDNAIAVDPACCCDEQGQCACDPAKGFRPATTDPVLCCAPCYIGLSFDGISPTCGEANGTTLTDYQTTPGAMDGQCLQMWGSDATEIVTSEAGWHDSLYASFDASCTGSISPSSVDGPAGFVVGFGRLTVAAGTHVVGTPIITARISTPSGGTYFYGRKFFDGKTQLDASDFPIVIDNEDATPNEDPDLAGPATSGTGGTCTLEWACQDCPGAPPETCPDTCDECCKYLNYTFAGGDINGARVTFHNTAADGAPCSYELIDHTGAITSASLVCTGDGTWAMSVDTAAHSYIFNTFGKGGCPPLNWSLWDTSNGARVRNGYCGCLTDCSLCGCVYSATLSGTGNVLYDIEIPAYIPGGFPACQWGSSDTGDYTLGWHLYCTMVSGVRKWRLRFYPWNYAVTGSTDYLEFEETAPDTGCPVSEFRTSFTTTLAAAPQPSSTCARASARRIVRCAAEPSSSTSAPAILSSSYRARPNPATRAITGLKIPASLAEL
jgi:hypothetical protein